jgi:hypothetical protein
MLSHVRGQIAIVEVIVDELNYIKQIAAYAFAVIKILLEW